MLGFGWDGFGLFLKSKEVIPFKTFVVFLWELLAECFFSPEPYLPRLLMSIYLTESQKKKKCTFRETLTVELRFIIIMLSNLFYKHLIYV